MEDARVLREHECVLRVAVLDKIGCVILLLHPSTYRHAHRKTSLKVPLKHSYISRLALASVLTSFQQLRCEVLHPLDFLLRLLVVRLELQHTLEIPKSLLKSVHVRPRHTPAHQCFH